jgi:hypothetical protein
MEEHYSDQAKYSVKFYCSYIIPNETGKAFRIDKDEFGRFLKSVKTGK